MWSPRKHYQAYKHGRWIFQMNDAAHRNRQEVLTIHQMVSADLLNTSDPSIASEIAADAAKRAYSAAKDRMGLG